MPASPTRRSVKWAAACLAWPLMLGCTQTASQGPPGPSPVGEDRLTVVCTTTMIADLVRNLAGEVAEVHGIMKEGEDPHVYDVRPRDAELIAGADLVLLNGYHLEATLGHVIDNNAEGEVVPLAERAVAQPLAGGDGLGAPDPHCWMNVAYFRRYADHARDALIQADPAQEAIYRRNTDQYQLALDELEAWIRQ
nr:zinc ABC transporter solute-binding protein [Planctomycetales bacterium]